MTWLSLFVALLIEQFKPLSYERVVAGPLARYAFWFEQRLNAGEARHGVIAWVLAVGLPVFAVWCLYLVLVWINPLPRQEWLWHPSIKLMNELIGGRMHPLTLVGLAAAIDQL